MTDQPDRDLPPAKRRRLIIGAVLRGLLVTTVLVVLYDLLPLDQPWDTGTAVRLLIGLLVFAGPAEVSGSTMAVIGSLEILAFGFDTEDALPSRSAADRRPAASGSATWRTPARRTRRLSPVRRRTHDVAAPGARSAHHPGITPGRVICGWLVVEDREDQCPACHGVNLPSGWGLHVPGGQPAERGSRRTTWPRPCAHVLVARGGRFRCRRAGGITRASPMRVNSPIVGIEPVGGAAGRGELAFAPRLAATPCRCLLPVRSARGPRPGGLRRSWRPRPACGRCFSCAT